MKRGKKKIVPQHDPGEQYLMVSATGLLFVVEPFGYYWMFEGLPGLGYWTSKTKMMDFYRDAFGFVSLGKL